LNNAEQTSVMSSSLGAPLKTQTRRQSVLTKRLSALDYLLPKEANLDDATIGLVEKLFTDLVTTTEAYESLQSKEENLGSELSRAQAQVFPLRKEVRAGERESEATGKPKQHMA